MIGEIFTVVIIFRLFPRAESPRCGEERVLMRFNFPFAEDISAGFMGNKKKVTKIRDAGSR